MICRNCNARIEDDSVFCRACGVRVAKTRRERDQAPARYPKPRQMADGTFAGQLMLDGNRVTVRGDTIEQYRAKIDALRTGLVDLQKKRSLTLGAAIDIYLEENKNRLSPATLRPYQSNRKNQLQGIMGENIYSAEFNPVGYVLGSMTGKNTKTIKNAWALCTASMRYAGVEPPKIKFPKTVKKDHAFLDYRQIPVFLNAVRGDVVELGALLALHSLRCSELLALTGASVAGDVIRVRGAIVDGPDGLVFKELNKTDKSRRDVPVMIPRLSELVKGADPSAPLVTISESWLYQGINRICREAGLPEVGIHGLRHSFASLAGSHLGLREESVQQLGGWVNSAVVKEVYTHNADLDEDVKKLKRYYKKAEKACKIT